MSSCPRYGPNYKRCGHYRPYGCCGQCGVAGGLASLAQQLGVDPDHAPMGHDEPALIAGRRRGEDHPIAWPVKVKPRRQITWPTYLHDGIEFRGGDTLPTGDLVAFDVRDRRVIAYALSETAGIWIEASQAEAATAAGWRRCAELPMSQYSDEPDYVLVRRP